MFDGGSSGHSNNGGPRPKDLQRIEQHFLPIALCSAANTGDVATLADLLQAGGAHVNAADYDGRTPLHIACAQSDEDTVAYVVGDASFAQLLGWLLLRFRACLTRLVGGSHRGTRCTSPDS